VSAIWRCGVCETVNDGGRSCVACGADLTRRSALATTVRTRMAPVGPPPPPVIPAPPLPEPVRRGISREPVSDDEWDDYEEESGRLIPIPIPGGCLMIRTGRSW